VERLRKLWDRRPGQRSDLVSAGVVSTLDPGIQGSTAGRTDRLIANKTGQSVSEVRRRHRVFGSPLLTPEVREKLDSGSTSLKKVAETIVAIEGEPVVRDAVLAYRRGPSNPANTKTIDEAKDALKARISASPTPAPSEPNVMTVSLSLAETPEGTFIGEVASPWGGRRDRLEVTVEPRNTGLVVTITQRRVQTMLMRKP